MFSFILNNNSPQYTAILAFTRFIQAKLSLKQSQYAHNTKIKAKFTQSEHD
jgi:hypothetical protein